MSNDAEIPTFKLAKVGAKRERKKGGLPFWWGARSAGSFSGAYGGGAVGGILGGLGAKIGVAVLAGVLGAGAFGLGRTLAPNEAKMQAAKQTKIFADGAPRYAGDLSGLPTNGRAPDSLGMVSGSLDGKTPEQRAADAAAEQAAAKAEAEKQAKKDAAAPEAPNAPGAPDPASLLAGAAGGAANPGKGTFASRFGALSNGLSGHSSAGLAGGAGLSGGVGQSFGGSLGQAPGRITGVGAGRAPSRASASVGRPSPSRGRGLARRQLDRAADLSNQARVGANETRATNADIPFTNNPGAGSAITGVGAGTPGAVGPSGGAVEANPQSGGPLSSGQQAMGPQDCNAQFPDGGRLSPTGGCVPNTKGKNVTPWQHLSDIAQLLMAIGSVVLLLAYAFGVAATYATAGSAAAAALRMIAIGLAYTAAALGAVVSLMGMVIMGQGQTLQGLIYTTSGAFLAVGGFIAAQGLQQVGPIEDASVGVWDRIKMVFTGNGFSSSPTSGTPTPDILRGPYDYGGSVPFA